MMRKRVFFGILFLLLLAAEAGIALFVHDRIIRPYIGDMLVVVLIYFMVRIVRPVGLPRLPLWIFLFAVSVEFAQYFHVARLLHLEKYRAARIILGSTFDWKDIACYGAGCLLIVLAGRLCSQAKNKGS